MTAFFNRVKFLVSSGGTGTFTVLSAASGFRTPSQASIADGAPVTYTAQSDSLLQWEVGGGTYHSGTQTISRDYIYENSNSDTNPVNFTQAPVVWLDYVAQDIPGFANVRHFGAKADGTDDAPKIQGAVRSALGGIKATKVLLPKNTSDGSATEYYCASSISLDNGGTIECEAAGARTFGDARMVFAAGVDGLIIEDDSTSPIGASGYGTVVRSCDIRSKSYYTGNATNGSPTVTDVVCAVDGSEAFAVGDGAIVQGLGEPAFSVPVGTLVNSVAGSPGNQTLTLNNNVTVDTLFFRGLWRLPAALMINVTTTSGSSTFTTTGGTVLLQPGDQLWCDAFPWGATVYTRSGSVGAQTITVRDRTLTTAVNATVTHSSGSGKLWKIPAGIRRRTTSKTYNVYCTGFPIGIGMAVSSGGGLNATESVDEDGFFEFGIVGRLTGGNNTGGSVSRGNTFANNFIHDIAECGTVGSLYVGDNSNSGSNAADAPIVGNVSNQNSSTFLGMYIDGGFSGAWDYSHNGATGTSNPVFIGNLSSGPSSNAWSLGSGELGGSLKWASKNNFFIAKNGVFGGSGVSGIGNAAQLYLKNFPNSGTAGPLMLINGPMDNIGGIGPAAATGSGDRRIWFGQTTGENAGWDTNTAHPLHWEIFNGHLGLGYGGTVDAFLTRLSSGNLQVSVGSAIFTLTTGGLLQIDGTTRSLRTALTSNTTYFIRTTGNDSNDGLTSGTAFATLQHAMDVISSSVDTSGFIVTFDVGAGSFVGFGAKAVVGGGIIYVNGAGKASTTITPNAGTPPFQDSDCIDALVPLSYQLWINHCTLSASTGAAIEVTTQATAIIGDPSGGAGDIAIVGGGSGITGILAEGTAAFITTGNGANNIDVSGTFNHLLECSNGAELAFADQFTFLSTPTTHGFVTSIRNATARMDGCTFVGTFTGEAYILETDGIISGGPFPGSLPGLVNGSGNYNSDFTAINLSSIGGKLTVNSGIVTANAPLISASQQWNNAAVNFHVIDINQTGGNTSFGLPSSIISVTTDANASPYAGNIRAFTVSNADFTNAMTIWMDGSIASGQHGTTQSNGGGLFDLARVPSSPSVPGVRLASTAAYQWSSTTDWYGTGDLLLYRDGAGILAQRNGANAQAFKVANTWTDASNNEYGVFSWQETSNVLSIGTQKAGTGSTRNLQVLIGGTNRLSYNVRTAFAMWEFSSSYMGHCDAGTNNVKIFTDSGSGNKTQAVSGWTYGWCNQSGDATGTGNDTGIGRNAAGVVEVNNGTHGTLADLIVRNLDIEGDTTYMGTPRSIAASYTVKAGYELFVQARVTMVSTQRVTLAGTGQLIAFDPVDTSVVGVPKAGSFTLPTDRLLTLASRLNLNFFQRSTLAGTSQLILTDPIDPSIIGAPKSGSFTVPDQRIADLIGQLALLTAQRATLQGTANLVLTDDFRSRSRIQLTGAAT